MDHWQSSVTKTTITKITSTKPRMIKIGKGERRK